MIFFNKSYGWFFRELCRFFFSQPEPCWPEHDWSPTSPHQVLWPVKRKINFMPKTKVLLHWHWPQGSEADPIPPWQTSRAICPGRRRIRWPGLCGRRDQWSGGRECIFCGPGRPSSIERLSLNACLLARWLFPKCSYSAPGDRCRRLCRLGKGFRRKEGGTKDLCREREALLSISWPFWEGERERLFKIIFLNIIY